MSGKQLLLILSLAGPCHFSGWSQGITVLDKISQQPIPGAKIECSSPINRTRTDHNGRFELEFFEGCDSLVISYPSYASVKKAVSDLKVNTDVELVDEYVAISTMTVTASRWEQDKLKVPGKLARLRMSEMALIGPQTSADLLESSGHVFVQKSQLAGGSPQLRGFGTNRVMIVVDGVRMNNAIFRSGNLQNVISLDANSLESAEVLFGPGAVIYGSDAIGGVMDFRTKQARFSPDASIFTNTNIFSRYSSSSNEITGHFDFNLGFNKWAFLTTGSFSMFGELRAGSNGDSSFLRPSYQTVFNGVDTTFVNEDPSLQRGTGYGQLNLIQKVLYQPNENWLLDMSVNFSQTTDAPRYDRLTVDNDGDGNLDNAEWYYGPQQWLMGRVSLVNTEKKKMYHEMKLNASYQNYRESRNDRKFGSTSIRRQRENVDIFSLNMDFHKDVDSTFAIFYGLEGLLNKVGSVAHREDISTAHITVINSRYPQSLWQSYGAYGNVRYDFAKKWTLNAGLRYSHFMISAQFDTSLFAYPFTQTNNSNGALNGSLGLVYNPNKNLQMYLNTSTGFRAPNVDDIGKVFDSEPGEVIVPNANLRPEYAYNAEIGFVGIIRGKLKLDGAVYGTYLNNALARSTFTLNGEDSILYEGEMSRVMAVQNVSDAYVYGIQAGVEWALFKGLTLRSTINWQKGEQFEIDTNAYFPIAHIAPLFGRTSLMYSIRRFRLNVYAMYHGELSAENLPFNERGDHVYAFDQNGNSYTPSWYTLNVKSTFFFNKHLSLTAGIENITDQLYRTFGSGVSASGRNYSLSLKATF